MSTQLLFYPKLVQQGGLGWSLLLNTSILGGLPHDRGDRRLAVMSELKKCEHSRFVRVLRTSDDIGSGITSYPWWAIQISLGRPRPPASRLKAIGSCLFIHINYLRFWKLVEQTATPLYWLRATAWLPRPNASVNEPRWLSTGMRCLGDNWSVMPTSFQGYLLQNDGCSVRLR